MQDPTSTAREHLKNMPDEVFELWIKPIVLLNGWPFTSLDSPLVGNFFGYFLGHSLTQISELNWFRVRSTLCPNPFAHLATKAVEDMHACHCSGAHEQFEVPADSYERFVRCRAYIEEHGKFPFPVILYRTVHGFMIFDGHHRLAALFALIKDGKILPFDIECWVGESPAINEKPEQGEAPNRR